VHHSTQGLEAVIVGLTCSDEILYP
jgi:hypothetical protein